MNWARYFTLGTDPGEYRTIVKSELVSHRITIFTHTTSPNLPTTLCMSFSSPQIPSTIVSLYLMLALSQTSPSSPH